MRIGSLFGSDLEFNSSRQGKRKENSLAGSSSFVGSHGRGANWYLKLGLVPQLEHLGAASQCLFKKRVPDRGRVVQCMNRRLKSW